jgi:hypothetical protein
VSLFDTYYVSPANAKEELIEAAKALWNEAFAADPHGIEEVTRKVLGSKVSEGREFVFVWTNLTIHELHELRVAVYPTVLEIRGG